MPGYGITKTAKGLLPWSWAERRLKKSHNYWISTTRPDGSPHTMVVWGLWLDGVFYFSTGRQTVKARNLSANSKCVVCTEKANEAVIAEGTAEEVADVPFIRQFVKKYERKYHFDMKPYEDALYQRKDPLYAVRPRRVFGLYEKDFQGSATRWRF